MRVDVKPELLSWASERSRLPAPVLAHRFPRLSDWARGAARPTLRQLEAFARAVHVPIGFLFLSAPPQEPLPIPDFRTGVSGDLRRPSPDLLDTIYICERRQDWYREFAAAAGDEPRHFVRSARLADEVTEVAADIRKTLGVDLEQRRDTPTWSEARRQLIAQAEAAGILVMCNGVVLNNTRRKLDPNEFRGFTLADPFAPLIFINGADSQAAQMFTLAHELAHVWLGLSALGDEEMTRAVAANSDQTRAERWCDRVAAEVLAPLAAVRDEFRPGADIGEEVSRLARHFKVSSLVALRRIYDLGALTFDAFQDAYGRELEKIRSKAPASGGDFYLTEGARVGKRFAQALVESTAEGRTTYKEALDLLGITKLSTLHSFGAEMGIPL